MNKAISANLLGKVEGVRDSDGERKAVAEENPRLVSQVQHILRREYKPVAIEGIVVAKFDHVGASLHRRQ